MAFWSRWPLRSLTFGCYDNAQEAPTARHANVPPPQDQINAKSIMPSLPNGVAPSPRRCDTRSATQRLFRPYCVEKLTLSLRQSGSTKSYVGNKNRQCGQHDHNCHKHGICLKFHREVMAPVSFRTINSCCPNGATPRSLSRR